jgi:hypothetical protein
MLQSTLFNFKNQYTYPPFKTGLYLEAYFLEKIFRENPVLKRKYIPVMWTNFQIEGWFVFRKGEMQKLLDEWIINNPSENGYFTVVQMDDGPLLNLPNNTIVYGACSGNIPIPLIYEDSNYTLENQPKKKFNEKQTLCSFVGNITSNGVHPNVRYTMFNVLSNQHNFKLINSGGWTLTVNKELQSLFITETIDSKFALSPRGYGRSSFRFFECFKLGTIPVYIWNDISWLPFQNIIDYSKLCIVIHVSEIENLENILLNIDEVKYNEMLAYYDIIKHLFTLEGMSNEIIRQVNNEN